MKSPERVQRKIAQDYPDDGPKRVGDVLGAAISNVVSLLERMRQNLPSVEVKNGTSSYSKNSLTNTVPPSGKGKTLEAGGKEVIPSSDIASRNAGDVSGVSEEGITITPFNRENIGQNDPGDSGYPGKDITSLQIPPLAIKMGE